MQSVCYSLGTYVYTKQVQRRPRAAIQTAATTLTAEEHARALHVKLSIASSTGRLDLSDWDLTTVPDGVWDLGGDLEVCGKGGGIA